MGEPLACEECDLCCRLIAVPEIDKPRDFACRHLVTSSKGGGCCGLYPDQPESCKLFYCGFRASQYLPEYQRMPASMRPDRCGVVIGPIDEKDPKKLYLNVDPARPNSWQNPEVLEYIKKYIRNGIEVTLYVGDNSAIFKIGRKTVRTGENVAASIESGNHSKHTETSI